MSLCRMLQACTGRSGVCHKPAPVSISPRISLRNLFPRLKATYCMRSEKQIEEPGAIHLFVFSEPEASGVKYSRGSRASTV